MVQQIVFLCGARDFHAMDWYFSAKELAIGKEVLLVTDLIEAEGYKKLIGSDDKVFNLIILDKILFRRQSKAGHLWRNIVKAMVFPFQVILLKQFSHKHPYAIYHAHSMYYLFLAWVAGVTFIGTPQGSDILLKPYKSRLYRFFSVRSLKAARAITVDSVHMKEKVYELTGSHAHLIQNGIDIDTINLFLKNQKCVSNPNDIILSIRGLTPLYRIKDLFNARNCSLKYSDISITYIYPFKEEEYAKEITGLSKPSDRDLGRLERLEMYKLLADIKIVFSIPFSDSSPRSVYEAIFCGCAVAITYHEFYEKLPTCMKSRIVLVDTSCDGWFDIVYEKLQNLIAMPYIPSEEALTMFDQRLSFKKMEKLLVI